MSKLPDPWLTGLQQGWAVLGHTSAPPTTLEADVLVIGTGAGGGITAELLALLGTSAGRQLLGGVSAPWQNATVPQVQAGLQDMRFSRISLRQQAYQALHDLTGAAYFSSPQTWTVLGYPGPRDL